MKRVLGLAAVLVVGTVGAAHAAGPDCTQSIIAGTSFSETISFDNLMQVPVTDGTGSCAVAGAIQVPIHTYGVFRADSRVHSELDTGNTATYSLTSNGQTGTATVTGPSSDNLFFSHKYATGFTSSATAFSGTATIDTTGTDSSYYGEYDSIDLLMGFTTQTQQDDSFDLIGLQQLGIATHLDETAGLLTGGNQALEGPDSVTVLGGAGSYTLGAAGRYNLAEGFSLLGGASIVNFGEPGASASGLLAAGALRFVQPGHGDVRYMGEVGVQLAPLGLSFSRHYEDGTPAGTDATGSGTGVLAAIYAKGGVIWSPDDTDTVLFSATVRQGMLGIGSFVEDDPDTNPNLFAADLSGTSQSLTSIKTGADWTTKLAPTVDLTASLAVGAAWGSGASGTVFGVGAVSGAPQSTVFAQYGLRAGWDLSPQSHVDGFIAGSSGTGIGTHAQIGADYRMSF